MFQRNQFLLQIILVSIFTNLIIAQNLSTEEQISTKEIVQWINNFEDYNSPERIMQGTFDDKVNIQCEGDNLIINSMMFLGSEPPLKFRETFKIKDIIRIEDLRTVKEEFTFIDFIICSKPGSYKMESKRYNEYEFKRYQYEDKWIQENGCCSFNLRFKFPNNKVEKETQRVYSALEALMKNYGATPQFGSRF